MVDRFNALVDRGNLEFEAWFSRRTEPDRTWAVQETTWRFPHRFIQGVGLGQGRIELPTRLLTRGRPDLLVTLYASPSFLLGRLLALAGGVRVAFWVEVTFDAWVRRRRWKEAVKHAVFPGVDGVLTPGEDGRAFAAQYGVPESKIFIVPHVIDVERFSAASSIARLERNTLRARLGVVGCTFLYVGRLWSGKGLDDLFNAFGVVHQRIEAPMSLLIVGDGPEEARLRRLAANLDLPNVRFAGFRHEDLPDVYAASDVFVFPTLGDPYGLVLDEAMACGLPLISSSAAGELSLRLEHGRNGFIVPPHDVGALADAMGEMVPDPDQRARMGAESALKVVGRTPQRWAVEFERAVSSVLLSGSRAHVGAAPKEPPSRA
jgi:glycosyltransferase involved in cell wall biosynthesis